MSAKPQKRSVLPPLVFLSRADLEPFVLHHIASGLDSSLTVPEGSHAEPPSDAVAGFTEWGARRRGLELYVCWNWAVLQSSLMVLNPAALRANIQLMEGAAAVPALLNRAYLHEWIESLPWRDKVKEVVFQKS